MACTNCPSDEKRVGKRLSVMTILPLKTSSGFAAWAPVEIRNIPRATATTRLNFNIVLLVYRLCSQ